MAVRVIMAGERLALTSALTGVLVVEVIQRDQGIGALILSCTCNLNMASSYASILTPTLIGFLIFSGVKMLDHRIADWKNEAGPARVIAKRARPWSLTSGRTARAWKYPPVIRPASGPPSGLAVRVAAGLELGCRIGADRHPHGGPSQCDRWGDRQALRDQGHDLSAFLHHPDQGRGGLCLRGRGGDRAGGAVIAIRNLWALCLALCRRAERHGRHRRDPDHHRVVLLWHGVQDRTSLCCASLRSSSTP
ncbi:MAG: hypothetical protein H7245_22125 [Candidatus Saccharibacteria bacterium]|nr:hypothetical protein [Pseudorhodobacter sp.]